MLRFSGHGMMCPNLQGLVLCLLALRHGPGVLYHTQASAQMYWIDALC